MIGAKLKKTEKGKQGTIVLDVLPGPMMIKWYRKQKADKLGKYTQGDVAKELKTSPATLSRWVKQNQSSTVFRKELNQWWQNKVMKTYKNAPLTEKQAEKLLSQTVELVTEEKEVIAKPTKIQLLNPKEATIRAKEKPQQIKKEKEHFVSEDSFTDEIPIVNINKKSEEFLDDFDLKPPTKERYGEIYVLMDVERPGMCKVGRAINSTARTSQMKTGNPGLVRIFSLAVMNDAWVESSVHKILNEYHLKLGDGILHNPGVSDPSEWFAVSTSYAIRIILMVVEKFNQLYRIEVDPESSGKITFSAAS